MALLPQRRGSGAFRVVELPSGQLPMVEVLPQLRDVLLEFPELLEN
ncbi:hypothetical protein [Kitasatospora sp. NPDC094011]